MNKTGIGKYLLYAIGEIILVMIGILLALQVNNWNENRKLKKEEKTILRNLYSELKQNHLILESCIINFENNLKYTDSLRTAIGPELTQIPEDKIDYWIGRSIGETRTCDIETDVLESIRSSGDLQLIHDDTLKSKLSKWSSSLKLVQKEEDNWDREYSVLVAPYTIKNLAWDNIDKIFYPNDPKYFYSPFEKDNRLLLMDFEFSNIVIFHHWRQSRIEYILNNLKKETEELINLIDLHYSE